MYQTKENLQYLSKESSIFIYTSQDLSSYQPIFNTFKSYEIEDINAMTLDAFHNYVATRKFDIIMVEIDERADAIYEVISKLRTSGIEPYLLLYIKKTCTNAHPHLLNLSHGIIAEPFDEATLTLKLFRSLSDTCTVDYLSNVKHSLSAIPTLDRNNLDEYLDTYEGQVLFLSESLLSSVAQLDAGALDNTLIKDTANYVHQVSQIFQEHHYTKKVAPIFLELHSYLNTLKIEDIEVSQLDGFEYLARIIEDINGYLVEYFVDRIFIDVYVFQDSLQNSIVFMEDKLAGKTEDDSELDFF